MRRRLRALSDLILGAVAPDRRVCLILAYHSVGDGWRWSVSADEFAWQMDHLAARFRVVPLRDLRAACTAAPPEARVAAITFDDGYADNALTAAPLLAARGLPGTFFVATAFIGGMFPTSAGPRAMMTREYLRALADGGHEVGAHTVSHPRLTGLSPTEAQREVGESRRHLEDLLSGPVTSFAYPRGAVNAAVRDVVARCGFTAAVTTRWGPVHDDADWLALPRISIEATTTRRLFSAYTTSAAVWMERTRTWRRPRRSAEAGHEPGRGATSGSPREET